MVADSAHLIDFLGEAREVVDHDILCAEGRRAVRLSIQQRSLQLILLLQQHIGFAALVCLLCQDATQWPCCHRVEYLLLTR